VTIKSTVFVDVRVCSLVQNCRLFGGNCCLHVQNTGVMIEAADSSEMLVNFYKNMQNYDSVYSNLLRINLHTLLYLI